MARAQRSAVLGRTVFFALVVPHFYLERYSGADHRDSTASRYGRAISVDRSAPKSNEPNPLQDEQHPVP